MSQSEKHDKTILAKLNDILKSIQNLTDRITNLEDNVVNLTSRITYLEESVDNMNGRITELDKKFSKRCNDLEIMINQKVGLKQFKDLEKRVDGIQQQLERNELRSKQEQVGKEAYSKRFNLLIHGLSEDKNQAWEKERKQRLFSINSWLMV